MGDYSGIDHVFSVETKVLETAQMVRDEWWLQVQAPGSLKCWKGLTAKQSERLGGKLLSFKRIPFPQLAPYTAAVRIVRRDEIGREPAGAHTSWWW
jgi:hypothetical protein